MIATLGDSGEECMRAEGRAGLAEVFMKHADRLHRMIHLRLDRRVAGRTDPSDVLQETFLDAARQLDGYLAHPPMSPFAWLRFLARERLMAVHRQHLGASKRDARREVSLSRRCTVDEGSRDFSSRLAGCTASPSCAAIHAETEDRLKSVIEGMEPSDREILTLRHYQELSNQEAAARLGLTPAAASKRYVRALERLKGKLTCAGLNRS